jgi:hypothetical protein
MLIKQDSSLYNSNEVRYYEIMFIEGDRGSGDSSLVLQLTPQIIYTFDISTGELLLHHACQAITKEGLINHPSSNCKGE